MCRPACEVPYNELPRLKSDKRRADSADATEELQPGTVCKTPDAATGGDPRLSRLGDWAGQRLVKHSSRSHLAHDFHLVDMKEPNAFALPGSNTQQRRGGTRQRYPTPWMPSPKSKSSKADVIQIA